MVIYALQSVCYTLTRQIKAVNEAEEKSGEGWHDKRNREIPAESRFSS